MKVRYMRLLSLALMTAAGFLLSGCDSTVPETESPSSATASEGDRHGGWWCVEHGVPEEVCTRCSPKLAADFQAKGDWCDEHNLPDSQCFVHHPELEAKFTAQYKAKMGTEPPKPTN